ncbi:MAG: YicC family protein [Candidatus Omnitrophica bacterium]|nr:YicC family protein [Candidatus Omnitrophota bacterium]
MIRSMTGFGKGDINSSAGFLKIEVKTFNHKFFELSCKLPENLQAYEEQIKSVIRKKISRGKFYLWVQYEPPVNAQTDVYIDYEKLERYYKLLKGVKKKFDFKDDITLSQLMSFPEIIKSKPPKEDRELLLRAMITTLQKALDSLVEMRKREGASLYVDLKGRSERIEKSLLKIKRFLPAEINRYKKKLKEKLSGGYFDRNGQRDERIEAEAAIFSKGCDISEELTRLISHIENFRNMLKSAKEIGKVLDFIAQEMHREINTVGAKSSDFKISKEVIFIKSEIEKIREQVQNIE